MAARYVGTGLTYFSSYNLHCVSKKDRCIRHFRL